MKTQPKIEGEYRFKIWKDPESGWYLAEGGWKEDPGGLMITQGRTPEEIFVMVADAFMCCAEVKVSWWNRLLAKLNWYAS